MDGDFAAYGRPLKPLEEEDSFQNLTAKNSLRAQQVRDDRGRQRFHGAFTGGFSAGYFNSVDTKEGWKPSEFKSGMQRKPEDFMDEEDFSEFGIAPKEMAAGEQFVRKHGGGLPSSLTQLGPSAIPALEKKLSELVSSSSSSMAAQIMQKMGWREGQGLGVKVKRKLANTAVNHRLYGCSMPAQAQQQDVDDRFSFSFNFAPKDVSRIDFTAKDDVHGIGYSGMQRDLVKHSGQTTSGPAKKGMSGQSFGIGALEEEDDDIYGTESLSNYNTQLPADGEDGRSLYGWTAPSQRDQSGAPTSSKERGVIEGFCKATHSTEPPPKFTAPLPPRDYKPVHRIREEMRSLKLDPRKSSAKLRGALIGEKAGGGSVFDLISEADRSKLDSARGASGTGRVSRFAPQSDQGIESSSLSSPSVVVPAQLASQPSSEVAIATNATMNHSVGGHHSDIQPGVSVQPDPKEAGINRLEPLFKAAHLSNLTFKPFSKNPPKQERYQRFLAYHQKGDAKAYEKCVSGSMAEWERQREKAEFLRSAKLYKPMSNLMASRFTRAKMADDVTESGEDDGKVEVRVDEEVDTTDSCQAAKIKMFGRLTHTTFEWHPHKLVCRRFNLANPYPDSTFVGLPKVRKDKVSVYHFLDVASILSAKPASERARDEKDSGEKKSQEEKKEKVEKPLVLPSESKPPMDLFKAIFDSDSEDDNDNSDEEEMNENGSGMVSQGKSGESAKKHASSAEKPIQVRPSVAHTKSEDKDKDELNAPIRIMFRSAVQRLKGSDSRADSQTTPASEEVASTQPIRESDKSSNDRSGPSKLSLAEPMNCSPEERESGEKGDDGERDNEENVKVSEETLVRMGILGQAEDIEHKLRSELIRSRSSRLGSLSLVGEGIDGSGIGSSGVGIGRSGMGDGMGSESDEDAYGPALPSPCITSSQALKSSVDKHKRKKHKKEHKHQKDNKASKKRKKHKSKTH